jgi:hypothetical protein
MWARGSKQRHAVNRRRQVYKDHDAELARLAAFQAGVKAANKAKLKKKRISKKILRKEIACR